MNYDEEKVIMQDAGVTLTITSQGGYSYYIEEVCVFENLPSFMKPMLVKSFKALVKIRKEEQKNEE